MYSINQATPLFLRPVRYFFENFDLGDQVPELWVRGVRSRRSRAMIYRQLSPVVRHIRKLMGVPVSEAFTDRQLLERFTASGDDHSFAALVERYGPLVLGVCRRILHNPSDAE